MVVRLLATALIVLGTIATADAREQIRIVGSPLVLAYAEPVVKRFALNRDHPMPSMVVTGTGTGFGMFCAGVGYEHPDVQGASRRIAPSEFAACQRNGVREITEIAVGMDAVVLATSTAYPPMNLTRKHIFAALARQVESNGRLVPNSAVSWHDVDPVLPDQPIQVMGPPVETPTHYGFLSMVMEAGCGEFLTIAALDQEQRYRVCRTLRRDGAYRQGAKNEQALVAWLKAHPGALGVMSFHALDRNPGLTASTVDGVAPTEETLSNRRYVLASPLYLYVKTRHVTAIPGLQAFLYEFTSERAISPDGYLMANEAGFVPLDDMGRNRARDMALSLQPITMDEPPVRQP